jgi:hypothetical protein
MPYLVSPSADESATFRAGLGGFDLGKYVRRSGDRQRSEKRDDNSRGNRGHD